MFYEGDLGGWLGKDRKSSLSPFLAHDLQLLDGSDYSKLSGEVTEVKRMLTPFIQKLKADR